jgi:hypothetical protein
MNVVFEQRKEITKDPYRIFPFDNCDRIAIYSEQDYYTVTRDILINDKWCFFRTIGRVKKDAGDNSILFATMMAAKAIEIKCHKAISIIDMFHVVPPRATLQYDEVLAWKSSYESVNA